MSLQASFFLVIAKDQAKILNAKDVNQAKNLVDALTELVTQFY